MIRRSVVPERNIVDTPLKPDMRFLGGRYDLHEIPDDGVAFGTWDTDDFRHEARVEEQRLPAGDGIDADERMLCRDWLAADRSA